MPDTTPPRPQPVDRRHVLRLTASFSATFLLSACGGGSGSSSSSSSSGDAIAVVPGPTAVSSPVANDTTTATLSAEAVSLNLALNLEYLGAQFYAYAATGAGLPAAMTGGIGSPGSVAGGRKASLADILVAQHAREVAADKLDQVTALRAQLAASAAAQPMIDFTTTSASAFGRAALAAGIVASGSAFDPFTGDANFLLGALLLENVVAATYRREAANLAPGSALDTMNANLASAIYHGGLIRSLLADRATGEPALTLSSTALFAYMAKVDGSDIGDQTLTSGSGDSSNIVDADGHAIPFTRGPSQVLRLVYLNSSSPVAGGFLPNGANGVRV